MHENEINQLVQLVVEKLIAAESDQQCQKQIYVIFTDQWNNRNYLFFDEMKEMRDYQFYAVIPDEWKENGNLQKLSEAARWQEIVCRSQKDSGPVGADMTVFPCFGRSLAAKTALGIDDTYETRWIRQTMEQGGRIVLLKSGLDRFTGKEPKAYEKTILDYYRTLLEFNIELVGSLTEIDNGNKE